MKNRLILDQKLSESLLACSLTFVVCDKRGKILFQRCRLLRTPQTVPPKFQYTHVVANSLPLFRIQNMLERAGCPVAQSVSANYLIAQSSFSKQAIIYAFDESQGHEYAHRGIKFHSRSVTLVSTLGYSFASASLSPCKMMPLSYR